MPRRKFTLAEVEGMRERYENGGITQAELAAHFQVSQGTISRILSGHVYSPEGRRPTRRTGHTGRGRPPRLSAADVQEIRIRRLYLHETLTSIAERFDVAHSYIHQVAIGAARADVPESEEEAAERKRHEALHEACQAAIKGLQDGTIPFDDAHYTESPEERRKRIRETMGVEEVKPR